MSSQIAPCRARLASILGTAICLVFSVCASAGDPALGRLLQKGVAIGYPGMAMVIEGANGRVRRAAAGYSDLEHDMPLRVDDGFHMASISKTFTAAAALRLADQGKLSLKATLKDVLGDAATRIPYADQILVAQLLDHSSGIYATNNDMDYVTTLIGPKADPHRVWKPSEMVALADKDRQKPSGMPGTGHYYSDTNYILLGMIVEKVAGRPYKEYITQMFFEPLGMRSTYFYSDYIGENAKPPMKTVQGYLLATKDLRAVIDINPMFKAVPRETREAGQLLNTTLAAERVDAASGVVTTLSDLAKFASPLFRGRLLSPESQKFLMAAGEGMEAQPIGKHRTWTLQSMRKPYGVLIYKEGDGPGGVNTLMAYLPVKNEIYLGFTNSFGNFNEVDFMMDEVIGPIVAGN